MAQRNISLFLKNLTHTFVRRNYTQCFTIRKYKPVFNFYNKHSSALKVLFGGGTGAFIYSISLFGKSEKTAKNGIKAQDIESICSVTDILYKDYLIDQAYNILEKYRDSKHTELLWRLARVINEKGKQSNDTNVKKKYFKEAFELAENALKYEPVAGCSGAHKWYAIILSYYSELLGMKEYILKSYEIKSHFERALEIDAFDATTWHLLGRWHFDVADLSSTKRLLARTFFAKPPESSYEDALRHFEKAETLNPNFYSANHYFHGITLDRLNRKEEALNYLKKAFTSVVITQDDKDFHEKSGEYLKNHYRKAYDDLIKEAK